MDHVLNDYVSRTIAIALGLGLLWLIFKPKYHLVIRIREGKATLAKGKITAAHLRVVEETCALHGVREGWIGRLGGRKYRLRFSASIPPECRQQLRNLWPVHV